MAYDNIDKNHKKTWLHLYCGKDIFGETTWGAKSILGPFRVNTLLKTFRYYGES